MKKQLYDITWGNIAPPYKDYEYFSGCEHFPYDPKTKEFSMVNAWWLIEAATLSYAEEEYARGLFQKAGFFEVRYFTDKSTQCYVVSNKKFLVVAFRGTESRKRKDKDDIRDIVKDIKADADIRLVDSGKKGKVHRGFSDALDEVWQDLHVYVKGLQNEGRTVWITGHSLGAALATLAAYRYEDVQGLYTFGSPRVGNEDFVKDFCVTAYRFENNNDIVCKVPPPLSGLYAHAGKLKYIDIRGKIHDDISHWKRWKNAVEGRFKNAMSILGHGFQGLVPDAIKDHVPVLYAIHIWNSLAAR